MVEFYFGFYDYDLFEYIVIINDWLVELFINWFINYYYVGGDNKFVFMLINGEV